MKSNDPQSDLIKRSDLFAHCFPIILLGMLMVYLMFPIEAIHMSASPIAIGSSIQLNMQILIMMFLIACSYLFGDVIINASNDKDLKVTTGFSHEPTLWFFRISNFHRSFDASFDDTGDYTRYTR